jgi:hypothetical protein
MIQKNTRHKSGRLRRETTKTRFISSRLAASMLGTTHSECKNMIEDDECELQAYDKVTNKVYRLERSVVEKFRRER